ncbi:MAG TPA: NADH-quinone oxidoreductase subunit L [Phycisphaerae bacterium]|nr:NADH-quinone oxidoreductase subunit L [Phycisphaerae bacterium]
MSETAVAACSILILLCPLLGAGLIGALGRPVLRGRSHAPAIIGVGIGVIASFVILHMVRAAGGAETAHVVLYQWFVTGAPSAWFNVEVLVDALTAVMLVTVTFVSLLVIIYSRDYMREHGQPARGYERFFAFLALFVFSMCALVLAGNFLLLYLGWELVGLCSYLLIGFYYQRPAAAAAAKKAFLVNRIGDFGFGLGILLIYLTIGHLDYETVFGAVQAAMANHGHGDVGAVAAALNTDLATAVGVMQGIQNRVAIIALLLFCGAIGKSAQLPLYVWLPDAMEGPSPVSALIHAATMVTAGVYMVARCGVIFTASPAVMTVVALVGAVTALYAATIALTQHDMKRILAYSTVSQLGYMFLGLGVYAAGSAIFHLFTHAFFKALLFLSAGSVMHAMGGIIDLRHFGGLRRIMPWTCRFCVIGALALAGFPLFSGFWSKDEIIHHAFQSNVWLGLIGLVTAALTAFYTGRMIFRAFWGLERVPEGVHAHESGRWILVPLGVLAAGAVLAGYIHVGGFIEPVTEPFALAAAQAHHTIPVHETLLHAAALGPGGADVATHAAEGHNYGLMAASGLIVILALGLAYLAYVIWPGLPSMVTAIWPRAYRLLFHKYYVDEIYDAGVVQPLRGSGRLCFGIDEYVVDGLIWLVTAVPRALAYALRGLQSGAMQGYGVTMATGLAIIVLVVLLSGW